MTYKSEFIFLCLCYAEPQITAPSVVIRRSLSGLMKGNLTELECEVTQLSALDLYITFQANGRDISDKMFVDLPKAPGHHSITQRYSVQPSYWDGSNSFSCRVNQGFYNNFESNYTGNIFGESALCFIFFIVDNGLISLAQQNDSLTRVFHSGALGGAPSVPQ